MRACIMEWGGGGWGGGRVPVYVAQQVTVSPVATIQSLQNILRTLSVSLRSKTE